MRRASLKRNRGEGAFGLIVGLAIAFVVVFGAIKVMPLHIHGNELWDTMNEQANFGTYKSLEKIQWEVGHKAEELGLPLPMNDIKVYKRASNIVIQAKYTQTVDVLGYKYKYTFDRTCEKPVF